MSHYGLTLALRCHMHEEPSANTGVHLITFNRHKKHLVEDFQLSDKASAHLCLPGGQRSSRYFPAGKKQDWNSHFQISSGNLIAGSWCFYSPSASSKINGLLL